MDRTGAIFFVRVLQQQGGAVRVEDQTERVVSMTYEEDEKTADKLEIVVDNFDLTAFDQPIWRKGNKVEVSWGYPGSLTPTRTVIIQSVKGFTSLTIVALSKSIAMHKTTKSKTFKGASRAAIVAQIAAANGYGSGQQHIEETDVVYDTITQARETDAAFLRRLASREGFEFFVDFDGLHWHRRKLGQSPFREYIWYRDPGAGDILSIDIQNDVTAKPASVSLKGRDPLNKSDIGEKGSNKDTARTGIAPELEVVDPITGQTTVQAASGQDVTHVTTEPNAAAAKRVADGAYINSVMTTVILNMKAVGDPNQLAKTIIKITGIRSLSGNYYVSKVKHEISPSGGYTMELGCRRDGRLSLNPPGLSSAAKQNKKDAPKEGTLEPLEVISEVTGQSTIRYVDSRGRPQGSGEGT